MGCQSEQVFRLLGLLGGLSVALDLGTGAPAEESLRVSLVATRFARALGADDDETRHVLYTSVLQHLGCTAPSQLAADVYGDDIGTIRAANLTDWGDPRDVFRTFVPEISAATGRSRLWTLTRTVAAGRRLSSTNPQSFCEVASDSARRLGLPDEVRLSLYAAGAQWNGKGTPSLRGEEIPRVERISQVAWTAVMFHLHAGRPEALDQLRRRSGTMLDPELAAVFDPDLLEGIEELDAYEELLRLEPDPAEWVDDTRLVDVARTFGDLVDLKSTFLHGHSTGVGDLAHDAARRLGLGEADDLRIAGYLHDLGRIAISNKIWEKPGGLTTSERDQMELHPYHSERILARVPALADVARLAGSHHERCNGTGYHRGLPAAAMSFPARLLAATDRYRNLVEDRPYRPAHDPKQAADRLRQDARDGSLDGDAVAAVLQAAGHPTRARRPRPAGLTQRQCEVLRLLSRGCSNAEIGEQLGISPRTAERHVQDMYERVGVSTRAAAAMFAMEHGLT